MLNNNHKNSSCGFTEQLVSYFYDETNQAEKAVFETHLTKCSHCTDELAGFGLVSSSLVEWRDEEFFKLDAPVFEIPMLKTVSQSVESGSRSWFSDLRRIISFNPITATAVLAALIVCIGLVFVVIDFTNNSEIAEVDNKTSEKIVISANVDKTNGGLDKTIAQNNSDKFFSNKSIKSTDIESKDLPSSTIREKRFVPSNSIVKVSDSGKNTGEKTKTNRFVKDTNSENKKSTAMQKQQLPNLTAVEDDEDESVRLADLFEEIGSQ